MQGALSTLFSSTSCRPSAPANQPFTIKPFFSMKHTLTIAFASALFVIACSKDAKQSGPFEIVKGIASASAAATKTDAEIIIKAETQAAPGSALDIDLQAALYDQHGDLHRAELFTVSNVEAPEFTDRFHYRSVTRNDEADYQALLTSFGSTAQVRVQSGGFGDFDQIVELPQLLTLRAISAADDQLSKGSDLVISWDPPSTDQSIVAITLTYEAANSNADNPDLPDENIVVLVETADNGEAVIPATKLDAFPVGGIVTVTLTRITPATSVKLENGNTASIQPLSMLHTNPLTVVN